MRNFLVSLALVIFYLISAYFLIYFDLIPDVLDEGSAIAGTVVTMFFLSLFDLIRDLIKLIRNCKSSAPADDNK